MQALVICECSGAIRSRLRSMGIDAWSCDVKPAADNSEYHIQGDAAELLESLNNRLELIVMHPPCTALALSGNRWYGKGSRGEEQRAESIEWTTRLWSLAKQVSKRVALENPASVIFKYLDAPVQYIQPWQFGHGETKKTGFALHNLPELEYTDVVDGREQRIWKMGPSPDRGALRSITYPGIADAIATQWGGLIENDSHRHQSSATA